METIANIGQNFIIGMPDTNPSQEFYDFIKNYRIGGVLFLGKNYDSPQNLIEVINKLQDNSTIYPLFTTVDHEGGRVQRFKAPFTKLPSYRELTSNKNPKEIFEISQMIANELLSVGINFNFAPVADMTKELGGVIGDRSIGDDLVKVDEVISATIRGFVKAGLLCCVKHFPGHGCTTIDSHLDLPVSEKTIEELLLYEILPFKKATKSGVPAIMTSHILFKNVDNVPASMSKKFIQDIIRKEFRFIKLVISDDISMGAISNNYTNLEASELALKAGTDMIIYSSCEIEKIIELIEELSSKAIQDTELMNSLQTSQARIKEIKKNIPRQKITSEFAIKSLIESKLKNYA